MLTYQVRPRVFRLEGASAMAFPADGEISFHFSPAQPFGVEAGYGHTAVFNAEAQVLFNANTGGHSIESKQPLKPLDVTIMEPDRTIQLAGQTLTITQSFESNEQLTELIEGLYFAIPMLLAVEFADPPIITSVNGSVGAVDFRWELTNWKMRFQTTTQEKQEQLVASSWNRLGFLSKLGSRRLVAALHYYYVALRLSRRGEMPGEFLAEMLLNFSKVLEVLFPPIENGKTRDAARAGLRKLDFSEVEIEADYIPAMALRNEIDVGHVHLALFTRDQLAIIHGYAEHAEGAFRKLFGRVFERLEDTSFYIEPYDVRSADGDAIRVVELLQQHADRYAP